MIDKKLAERILKAVINWNGQTTLWDKKFLELQDNFELVVKQVDERTIQVETKMKKK